jgi:WhiB family transcriptional regulator, redox-sensing transcriptional regulator
MTDEVGPSWRSAGACASADPDLFFPVSPTGIAAVQADQACRICAGCRVRRQCLEFAMEHGEMEGVWGGTTSEERIRVRRATTACERRPRPPGQAPQVA